MIFIVFLLQPQQEHISFLFFCFKKQFSSDTVCSVCVCLCIYFSSSGAVFLKKNYLIFLILLLLLLFVSFLCLQMFFFLLLFLFSNHEKQSGSLARSEAVFCYVGCGLYICMWHLYSSFHWCGPRGRTLMKSIWLVIHLLIKYPRI